MTNLTTLQQVARALRMHGSHISEAARFGRGPYLRKLLTRMENPKLGDLVFEVTTAYKTGEDGHLNAIGYLTRQDKGATFLKTLDGRDERWNHALFYAIPDERNIGSDDIDVEPEHISELNALQQLSKIVRLFGVNSFELMISPSGLTSDIYQRMKKPQRGDLVFELSRSLSDMPDQHIEAVGFLLEQGTDEVRTWKEHFTRITTLDGREERWTNATFYAIPAEPAIAKYQTDDEDMLDS